MLCGAELWPQMYKMTKFANTAYNYTFIIHSGIVPLTGVGFSQFKLTTMRRAKCSACSSSIA